MESSSVETMASESYSSDMPPEQVFEAAVRAIESCGWEITEENEKAGVVIAKTGMSLRSWGEEIVIQISTEEGKTLIHVSSESSQLLDWGKSSENLKKLGEKLREI